MAASLSGMAETLRAEGHEGESDQYSRETLAIYRQHPDLYHRERPMLLFNVAIVAGEQNKTDESRTLLEESVAQFEEYEGPGSTNLAMASTSLAEVYSDDGRFADSESLLKRALAIQKAQLPANDPAIARTMQDLAVARRNRGSYSQAASLERASTAIYSQANPTKSVEEGALLARQARAAASARQYKRAESLYKQAIEADKKKYGTDYSRVGDDLQLLAELYRDQPSLPLQAAEPLFEQAMVIRQKTAGPDSSDAAQIMSGQALLYFYEKKYKLGESAAARALPIQEKTRGRDSLDVSTTLNRLGLCQRELNKFPEAEKSLKRSLAIREKHLPPNHAWIATSLQNLASVYIAQHENEKASPLLARSNAINSKIAPSR